MFSEKPSRNFPPIDAVCQRWFDKARVEPYTRAADLLHLRELQQLRLRRREHFNAKLFADPAWDILLELYAAEVSQRRIFIGRLCKLSGMPGTTALRWLDTLEREGLIARRNDPLDGRRKFVELTEEGSNAMRGYLSSLPRPSLQPGG